MSTFYQISLERDFITIFTFKGWLKFFLHKKSISAVRFYIHKPVINLVCRKDKTEKYFSISVAKIGGCPQGVCQEGVAVRAVALSGVAQRQGAAQRQGDGSLSCLEGVTQRG